MFVSSIVVWTSCYSMSVVETYPGLVIQKQHHRNVDSPSCKFQRPVQIVAQLGTILSSSSSSCYELINLTETDLKTGPAPGPSLLSVKPFMWRGGSGGTGSGPVGDVAAQVVAQNIRPEGVSVTGSQWLSQSHPQPPRRCDSSELADSPIRTEAIKLVRDLNRAVATHVALATLLGGSGDGPHLRDELRRARRTAQEAAAAAKATLLPALLDPRWAEKERTELERLWHLLLSCLDSLGVGHLCSKQIGTPSGKDEDVGTSFEKEGHRK
ncbi:unnamed protein product [Allacma fusca]|uniref:Uncharacterized protein n=1 Tax=Allacma fusca TaxID=39272 RepID=A0A8J2KGI6_9HEXA|nr:unnamed protein product [Allacma fusca]